MKPVVAAVVAIVGLFSATAFAQAPSEPFQSAATVRQLMVDLIHPASNDLLLFIYRGTAEHDEAWGAVRRSAITLAESGSLLTLRGRARDQGDWIRNARALTDIGNAAYQAARDKDVNALAALAEPLDATCTTCHTLYRPNVFPRERALK
jgi:cytochrome c556